MKLEKVNECVNRSYNGKASAEEITSVSYDIIEGGSTVGSVAISQGGYVSINVQMPGTMSDIKAKVETFFQAK